MLCAVSVRAVSRPFEYRTGRCRFFFSSRRRHTRCSRDWSSDVCSSDLPNIKLKGVEITDCDTLVVEGTVEATMDSRVIQIAEQGAFHGTAEIDIAEIHGDRKSVV